MIDIVEADVKAALRGRRVLLTGHTGFKGGWLAIWLHRLGANVRGIALPPHSDPALYNIADIGSLVEDRTADIRSAGAFADAVSDFDAEVVIHMAAQSLVRPSYENPVETYQTNVVGTAIVLDAVRRMPSAQAVIVVTSDKCYQNNEWVWGYRENDPMGGSDPYSSSKGCTELVVNAYRKSFFADDTSPGLATVRAGNVFGGGDWSVDRLIPDIIRGAVAGTPIEIRNPSSIRPWQHVLEPLWGYLVLATRLLENKKQFAGGWNFGPNAESTVDVATLANLIRSAWPEARLVTPRDPMSLVLPEAGLLRIDSTKAVSQLGWGPQLSLRQSVELTVDWYRAHTSGHQDMRALTLAQIESYAEKINQNVNNRINHSIAG